MLVAPNLGRGPTLSIYHILFLILCLPSAFAKAPQWIEATNAENEVIYLADDRKPALYTKDFGDCLGSSTINVTRFDAAYYQDNMTVLFHLEGNTAVANESLMSILLLWAMDSHIY